MNACNALAQGYFAGIIVFAALVIVAIWVLVSALNYRADYRRATRQALQRLEKAEQLNHTALLTHEEAQRILDMAKQAAAQHQEIL